MGLPDTTALLHLVKGAFLIRISVLLFLYKTTGRSESHSKGGHSAEAPQKFALEFSKALTGC